MSKGAKHIYNYVSEIFTDESDDIQNDAANDNKKITIDKENLLRLINNKIGKGKITDDQGNVISNEGSRDDYDSIVKISYKDDGGNKYDTKDKHQNANDDYDVYADGADKIDPVDIEWIIPAKLTIGAIAKLAYNGIKKLFTKSISESISVNKQQITKIDNSKIEVIDDNIETSIIDNKNIEIIELDWQIPQEALDKVPDFLRNKAKPNRRGDGTRWNDRSNDVIRIDKGNPNADFEHQKIDHVSIINNGKMIGRNGKIIQSDKPSETPEAHIPLSEWIGWTEWNKP